MPLVEKNPPAEAPADPFAWDPDPVVLVSRRPRILYFPHVLLEREATADELKRWSADDEQNTPTRRRDEQFGIQAGVTFLGTYTTSWADMETRFGQASSGPAHGARMLLVEPFVRGRESIVNNRENRDASTGRLIPARVNAIYMRILRYHREQKPASGALDMWTPGDGFDAPELQLVRLSEVFSQKTEAGQQANATIMATIKHLRRDPHEVVTPLGALHDYAIRHRQGMNIVEECRKWAVAKKVGN